MPARRPAPADFFLPLTEVVWEVLLALAEGERHGYAILVDVERRTGGRLDLLPGSLYRALHRLRQDRLVEEVEGREEAAGDARRRVYRLTGLGRRVAAAEARRLAGKVAEARLRGLLPQEELP
jgi:DNA-binding PadR family transcriptional regulator